MTQETGITPTEAAATTRTPGLLRRNWVFVVVFTVGVLVRVAVELAYKYPFVQPDSKRYLKSTIKLRPDFNRTSGYSLLLRLIPGWHSLWPIPIVQHIFGLAIGVMIYWVLVRRDVPRWGAALATIPALLDPFQVDIEHYILSDATFELFLVAGFAMLTFRRTITWRLALFAGLLMGLATVTREVGDVLVVAAVVVLLLGQAKWKPAIAVVVGLAIPLAAYTGWYHSHYDKYSTGRFPQNLLYGQVAEFVQCSGVTLPTYEQPLCPKRPRGDRGNPYFYTWGKGDPSRWYTPPAGMTTFEVMGNFSHRVIRAEPVAYLDHVVGGALRGFGWARHGRSDETGETAHWRFGRHGIYPPSLAPLGISNAKMKAAVRPNAGHILSYYSDIYLPGPFYAAMLLIGLAAALGVGRARRSGMRTSALLYSITIIGLLLISTAVSIFSWRYQLPQFLLLPPAGALGLTAMLRREPVTGVRTWRNTLSGIFFFIPGRKTKGQPA